MRYHFPARNGYVVYSQVDVGGHHDRGRRGDGETEAGKEGGEAHEDLTEVCSNHTYISVHLSMSSYIYTHN